MSEFLNSNELENSPEELDVQKVVVEQLATDKAELEERIKKMQGKISDLYNQVSTLKNQVTLMKADLERTGEILAANTEKDASNQVSLLDRNFDIQDRFIGETRDTVLEVLKDAREQAEKDGRVRRAQLLEAVLLENEPIGNLAEKRTALIKFFAENSNILSGPVVAELKKVGISYKNGENYLLPGEIVKRMY